MVFLKSWFWKKNQQMTSKHAKLLLQTVWTGIRPDSMSGLIRIQTVWHSDGISERILQKKKLFWKKISRRQTSMQNYFRKQFGPRSDQDLNCLTHWWYSWNNFIKNLILKKISSRQPCKITQWAKSYTVNSHSLKFRDTRLFSSLH